MKNNYVSIDIKNDKNGSNSVYGRHALRIAIVFAALVLMAGSAGAATLTVDDSGGADYSRIQDAINNASAGDTILVYSGTYYENVNVTKQLTLRGIDTGGGKPVVDANRNGSAISLNADGCTLEGFNATNSTGSTGENVGINIISASNNIIKNNDALNNEIGIILGFSNNNTLSGNNALDNTIGIGLIGSGNNTLTNNRMSNNKYNFNFNMYDNFFSLNNTIYINNLVDERPIYYLEGASDLVFNSSTNAGTFYCMNCFNVTVEGLNLNKNSYGIVFWNTTNSQIKNNNVSDSQWGIYIGFSTNNTLSGNHASNNEHGIYLIASNNTLNDNFVSNNSEGIYLYVSNNNTLIDNNATQNKGNGIEIDESSDNTLIGNQVSNNIGGISLSYARNSTLLNNIMIENKYNFELYGDFDNEIDISNLVDGKPIYYIKGAENTVFDSSTNAGTFYCISCENVTVKDMKFSNNRAGVFFWNTTISRIQNITASNNRIGVLLDFSSNNTLMGNNISNNEYGITLEDSRNNILSENNVSKNNEDGVVIFYSRYNTLRNNIIFENKYNFVLYGMIDSDFDNKIDTSNLVNGKPIYFIKAAANTVFDSSTNAGTFYCISCENVTIKDMKFINNRAGVFFWNTTISRIQNITAINNTDGISLYSSKNNMLISNDASNNVNGISLQSSNNNILSGNNASNNIDGISLQSSNNNTLSGNNASNNVNGGIFIFINNDNNILSTNIVINNHYGFYIESSNNNTIYNNFFNNTDNLDIRNSVNNWNNTKTSGTNIIGGPCLGGNVWANPNSTGFSQTCIDTDSDEICDSPYEIDSSNIDYLPLAYNNSSSAQLKGDVSGDGQVSVVDALFIAQYTVGTRALTSTQLAAADVNGDGQVTIVDALFIAQYTVGLRQL